MLRRRLLSLATAGCALEEGPRVISEESGLSTLFSYRGRVEVVEVERPRSVRAAFYAVNPADLCDVTGAFELDRTLTGLANADAPRRACTELAVDQFNAFNNPADLSTCTSYTAGFQTHNCRLPFSERVSYVTAVCDVTVTSTPRTHAIGTPAFVVRSIRYQVPGNRSTITYAAGDGNGSTWETTTSEGQTAEVQWSPIIPTGDSAGVVLKLHTDMDSCMFTVR